MNRSFLLLIIWVGLLVSVPLLRSHRFEQDDGFEPVTLEILKRQNPSLPTGAEWITIEDHTALRVIKPIGQKYLSFPLAIPGVQAARACHMVVSLKADRLQIGTNPWDTGRIMMFWKDLKTQRFHEFDMVAGVENQETIESLSQVMRPAQGIAEPHIRIEHLGASGALTITRLDLQPVVERHSWIYYRWVVVVAWIGGIALTLGSCWGGGWLRNLSAAALWIFCASLVSFPGPWKNIRPCVIPFHIHPAAENLPILGDRQQAVIAASQTPETNRSARPPAPAKQAEGVSYPVHPIQEVRKIPATDTWMVAMKAALSKIRWLIHALMLTLPCMAWLVLVGRRPTIALGLSFAVSMELAQVSFGFGFDGWDVLDLLWNAIGLLLAIGLMSWMRRIKWFDWLCKRLMPASQS